MKSIRSTIVLIALMVLASAAVAQTVSPAPRQPRGKTLPGATFSFVVMGDNRTPWGRFAMVKSPEVSPIFVKLIDQVNVMSPDLVLITGDLISGCTDDRDLAVAEWDAFDEAIEAIEAPVYMVVGNHDVWSEWSRKLYAERYGPEWFSFNHKGAHFIVLSSEVAGARINGAQLAWLKQDLKRHATRRPKYVFLHQPPWAYDEQTMTNVSRGYNEKRDKPVHEAWMRDVHPLLKKYGVEVVFGGHWHQYIFQEIDGIRYVITGGAGAEVHGPQAPEWRGRFYHYAIATVRGGKTHLAVARLDGIGPEEIVTPDTWRTMRDFLRQLIPTAIRIERGSNKLPRKVTCVAVNPFDKTIAGELQFSTPTGSPWQITPRRVLVSIRPGEKLEHSLTVTYTGNPEDEDAAKWQARCMASIKLGTLPLSTAERIQVVWDDREYKLNVDRWPYKERMAVLQRNQTLSAVRFSNEIAGEIVAKQTNPFDRPLKQTFSWTVPAGSRWKVSPLRRELTLPAGGTGEIPFDVEFTGTLDHVLPMPRLEAVAAVDGDVVARSKKPLPIRTQGFVRTNSRQAICRKAANAPVLDGKLDDAVWRDVPVNQGFMKHSGDALVASQTEFRTCYDDNYLYFGIRFHGTASPQAKVTQRDDDNIWVDDGVELFLDANVDRKTYYHIIINANGVFLDASQEDTTWNADVKTAAGREPTAWTLEVAIPWSAIQVSPERGGRLGLNLVRDWPSLQQYSHSQWSPTLGIGNHVPDRFGVLVLE